MERDNRIFDIIEREHQRQKHGIELIASENFVSDQVMQAMGSCLTNKYAEGYPGHRYYGGCQVVDEAEQLAINRVKELFGAEYANVQPHSGAQANMAHLPTEAPSISRALCLKLLNIMSKKIPDSLTTTRWKKWHAASVRN